MQKTMIPILYWAHTCRLCHAVITLLDKIGYSYIKVELKDDPEREGWDSQGTFISKDHLPAVPALYFPESKKIAFGYRISEVLHHD